MTEEKYIPALKGKSDFYSWQLFRWMKKNPDFSRIYLGVWNSATGYDPNRTVLYIGLIADNCFMGNLLARICTYKTRLESWAYCSHDHHIEEWQDVTESFFTDYKKRGVCAIHKGMAHKWEYLPRANTRTCKYCSEVQERKTVMAQKEKWVKSNYHRG